jgi:hypothetical protein
MNVLQEKLNKAIDCLDDDKFDLLWVQKKIKEFQNSGDKYWLSKIDYVCGRAAEDIQKLIDELKKE